MSVQVKFINNKNQVLQVLKEKAPVALEACGLAAEGYAKKLCAVDTGLLRNSITHAVSGEPPVISSYSDTAGEQHGEYSGSAPAASGSEMAVYLGTNVEYAPYVEMGTRRTPAQPFIKPAVANHQSDYKRLIEKRLKG